MHVSINTNFVMQKRRSSQRRATVMQVTGSCQISQISLVFTLFYYTFIAMDTTQMEFFVIILTCADI